jgi:hypothetical protein
MCAQLEGTFPAPLFLFPAGLFSLALAAEKAMEDGLPPAQLRN